MTKKLKLKLLQSSELIADERNGITKQTKYYECEGRKFRITYEMSNGCPLGFNYKKCLSQYDKEAGKWNNLVDIKALDMKVKCTNYYSMGIAKDEMNEFFTKMIDHLKTVYL
jgi:hypothetical protein